MSVAAKFAQTFFQAAAAELGHDEAHPPPVRSTGGPMSYVVDRHGERVRPKFDEITSRIEVLCTNPYYGPPLMEIDPPLITQQVILRFRSGMTTRELDATIVHLCQSHGTHSPGYLDLAARIAVSDLHKRSQASMLGIMKDLKNAAPERYRLSDELYGIIERRSALIDSRLDFSRDFRFSHFGLTTLAFSYLQRSGDKTAESTLLDEQMMERPQHLYMRVAIVLFCCQPDGKGYLATDEVLDARLEKAFFYYELLSTHKVSHATPTMLNAGTKRQQLSSCFKATTGDDLESLLDTVKSMGLYSKWAGGVSVWLSNVRSEGSIIRGTGGRSSGLKRYVRMLNELQDYVNQGGNRPGAFAIYLDVWHDDIMTFLELPRFKGVNLNAPSLKYGLMLCRLFIKAVREDGDWYTMCPDESPGLYLLTGEAFEKKYQEYVEAGKYRHKLKARDIFIKIWDTIRQRGVPYLVHRDNLNAMSNIQHVAPINSSNLCVEIGLPSWSNFDAEAFGAKPGEGEHGVCNLAALCLESFLEDSASHRQRAEFDTEAISSSSATDQAPQIDFAGPTGIIAVSAIVAEALDNIIDLNYTPTEEGRRSNTRHRPIGIGLMGLADVFARKKLIFGEPRARALDRGIAAAIHYGAMRHSAEMGKERGTHSSFTFNGGSPASKGLLQPDLWVKQGFLANGWEEEVHAVVGDALSPAHWAALRQELLTGHLRNVYVNAYMPTATTANIIGQNECFEPFTANIYTRGTQAGEFIVVNRHLMNELIGLGLWSDDLRRTIIVAGGSVQKIDALPTDLKRRFKTAREMDQRLITLHAKARAPFICQTMSLNYYFTAPTLSNLLTIVDMADREGLKTISYYIHSKPAVGSQKTSVKTINTSDFDDDGDDTVVSAAQVKTIDGQADDSSVGEADEYDGAVCDLTGDCTSCKL
jgi:ribonucleoside-diphosphate reductase alpha chain